MMAAPQARPLLQRAAVGFTSAHALKRQARAAANTAAVIWEQPHPLPVRKRDVEDVCHLSGVAFPKVPKKWGPLPSMLKTQAPEWWGRQLKKADRRGVELAALKAGRISHYCSADIANHRQEQKQLMREMLGRLLAVCERDDGTAVERELLELVEGSNANPAIRRMELMTRIRGFENYAKGKGHHAYFLTATCPARFHRNSDARWSGATPKEAQQYLCEVWARARAQLKRLGIECYGFRIAEPHKDACPHWHLLLWFKSTTEAGQAIAAMREHFLADSGTEPGARQRRFTSERIDSAKGSATGYIAKYICKNVDGKFRDGELVRVFDDQRRNRQTGAMEPTGITSEEAALRVEAWASCWGIRQFQQIGGPKVGAWRELRRLREEYTGHGADIVEPLRAAADAGQWDIFADLDDQHRARFGDRVRVAADKSADRIRALPDDADDEAVRACLNKWQEPTLREVQGVAVGWLKVKTRFLKWVLMLKEAAKAATKNEEFKQMLDAFRLRLLASREDSREPELERLEWWEAGGAPPPWPLESCQ